MEQNEILQELKELDNPLAGLPREMPYAVPKGYFEGLADEVLRVARTSDVPAGYFRNLPEAMLAAAKAANAPAQTAKPKTRVIALPMRRWAAAAVLLVSFGIGGALLFNASSSQSETAVASLPTEAVQEYVSANYFAIAATASPVASSPDLTNISKAELEAYAVSEGLLF